MKNKPLLSVIIPVYNAGEYLDRCLLSVERQTYDNLEIILINDGSKDNSLDICKKHALKDPRIILIDKENEGGGPARNAGLDIAKGEYITFVDSDDQIDPKMYEIMLSYILEKNVDMCICDYQLESEYKKVNYKDVHYKIIDNHELIKELFIDKEVTSHLWRKIYPKKSFNGHRFTNQKVVHDMLADTYFLKEVDKAILIDLPLYIYRDDNPNNLSNTNALGLNSSYFRAKVFIDRLEFADKNYPDLAYILLPQATNFLLSSYAKLSILYKDKKEELKYIKDNINKYGERILKANDISLANKITIYSINHHLNLISNLASRYYINNIKKFSK